MPLKDPELHTRISYRLRRPARRLPGAVSAPAARRHLQQLQLMQAELSKLYIRFEQARQRADDLLNIVIPLGAELTAEQDWSRLLEKIVLEARAFCNADAGSLYLRTPQDTLEFVVVTNASLDLAMGGTSGRPVSLPPLHLYDPLSGAPNQNNVATYAVLSAGTVNIPDAYATQDFDFSGTQRFDAQTGYRSTSFLTIPLKNVQQRVIGVLQLINAQETASGKVIAFDEGLQQMVESLSALATAALEAYIREQRLRLEIDQLRIELDEVRRDRMVSELTETEYFQRLHARAEELRRRHASG